MANNLTTMISELILTRMCHDVIGISGTVANAVELLEDGDLDFLEDITNNLKTSSSIMNARLKFFRLAFGLSNANLSDPALVFKTANDYLSTIGSKNYPINLKMNPIPQDMAKIALIAIMIVADTLIKGGNIEIGYNDNGLFVKSETPVIAKEKISSVIACIDNSAPQYTAQFAPIFYLKELLSDSDYNLYGVDSNSLALFVK